MDANADAGGALWHFANEMAAICYAIGLPFFMAAIKITKLPNSKVEREFKLGTHKLNRLKRSQLCPGSDLT